MLFWLKKEYPAEDGGYFLWNYPFLNILYKEILAGEFLPKQRRNKVPAMEAQTVSFVLPVLCGTANF